MKDSVAKLFDEVKNSIERIGIERTIFQLHKTNDEVHIDMLDYIVLCVCEELKLTKNFIFQKTRSHSQQRKQALILIAYLLYTHNSNTQKEIANFIGKDAPTINRYIKHVRELNDKIPHEKSLKESLIGIELNINTLKNKTNG
jgi:Fic family protein